MGLVLLLAVCVVSAATKIEIKSDKSATAEVAEDKAKQRISVSLHFMPVTTLDAVSNDEMTGVLAQFFAEEVLSSYYKTPKGVDFARTRCIVHKRTAKQCSLTFEIPVAAIVDVKEDRTTLAADAIRRYFSSESSRAIMRDFRSTCFHDLRIAEAIFLEQTKTAKDKAQLEQRIRDAFAALAKKINDDDALFLSEKEDLLTKAEATRDFLLKKLASGNSSADDSASVRDDSIGENVKIKHARILPEFKPFLLGDPVLLEVGGCKAFRTSDGKTALIAVGMAEVRSNSAKDRIRRQRVAETNAFGELSKHREVEVTFFAERSKTTSISTQNGVESGRSQRTSSSRITVRAEGYFDDMMTVGQWYSEDGKLFYLAKGCMIPQK